MDRKTLEMLMLAALRKKHFSHAVDLAFTYGYRSATSVPAGLEIWVKDAHLLGLVFSNTPALLASVPDEVLEQMRLIAGLLHLLGDDQPLQVARPANSHVPGTHIGSRWAPRMLLAHAEFLWNMENYRDHMISRPGLHLAVRHADDELVCPSCRELAKYRFRISDSFELPNPLCTCERGCRCHVHPIV
jgi:hypothetical protein